MADGPKLIKSTTLTSNAASVTLDSIPQTYTDLYIVTSTRLAPSGNENPTRININGGSTLHYSKSIGAYPSNAPFSSQNPDGFGLWQMYGTNQSGVTAGLFGVTELYLRSYSSTTRIKAATGYSVTTNTSGGNQLGFHGFNYDSLSQVTSITFTGQASQSFLTGSTFHIYGIKVD